MISIADYTLTARVSETSASLLYRGRRNRDGLAVVAKVLRDEFPSRLELARLKQEYALLMTIDAPEVVKAVALVEHGKGLALILEDLGDRSLAQLIGAGPSSGAKRLSIERFLELAISMATALDVLHAHGIIHRDVKPHHFLIDAESGKTKIIDLGLATRISRETPAISPERLVGTLAYMSPEQTGRMHRLLDRRADQYGLGASLYQLLIGELPFAAADPLELVHSHIARIPRAPREVRHDVPQSVSDVIMKLLAKVPEDRYHSAAGARADFEECLDRLRTGKDAHFALGQRDARGDLIIPQKLYGRAAASDTLLHTFQRVRAGAPELFLISGTAGVGKSALVHQIKKDASLHGHFAAGKFDQLLRTVPYSAIAGACQDLIRSLLGEDAAKIEAWKAKLARALGTNAQLVVDLVPELELVLGPQRPVAELGPAEAQLRFELVFHNFFEVFSADQPLALFLDDMQWTDPASLRLIQTLLTAGRGHLLVIGAFRENEVGTGHPLTLAVADIRNAGVPITELSLSPLELEEVAAFAADALGCAMEPILPLAEVLLRKTQGNPFFLGQFITALHKRGLVRFEVSTRTWAWDVDRIDAEIGTANVIDFMVEKILRLSPEAQSALRFAACIGFQFDSWTLARVSGRSPAEIAADLLEPLRDGLLVSLDARHGETSDSAGGAERRSAGAYRFSHDRVQQAAYAVVEDEEKEEVHLRIGRLLLDRYGENPFDENLFAVVEHLNAGVRLIADDRERRGLAQLGLTAGRRARRAAAHHTASALLGACLSLLGEAWDTDYAMLHAAYLAKAECEFLQGNREEAFRLLDTLESRAKSALDRAPARALRVTILTRQDRIPEAVGCSIETARMLGADLPTDPALLKPAIAAAFAEVQTALAGRTIEELLQLPLMQDREKLALSDVFYQAVPSLFQSSADMLALVVLRATALAIRHGNAPVSPVLYCQYGFVHFDTTGDLDTAHRFGQLAVRLAEKLKNRAIEGATQFLFAGVLAHWKGSLAEGLMRLRRGLRASLEAGDHNYVGFCARLSLFYCFYMGRPLEDVELELADCRKVLKQIGDINRAKYAEVFGQILLNLRGRTKGRLSLDSDGFDEAAFRQEISSNDAMKAVYEHLRQLPLYLAGDIDGALEAGEASMRIPPGFYAKTEQVFLYGLALAAKLATSAGDARARFLAALGEVSQTMEKWAARGSVNYAHRHALLAAELAAANGNADQAHDLFDRAITLAHAAGFLHHSAIASELAGKFHLGRGRTRLGRSYLADAYYAYHRWGASPKANDLALQYPDIIEFGEGPAAPESAAQIPRVAATVATPRALAESSGQFDLSTVIRAAQTIAGELELETLLERLMSILIENAGAQRGFLVLIRSERLEIAAAATVTPDKVEANLADDVETTSLLSAGIVQYVARTQKTLVFPDASAETSLAADPYVKAHRPRSLLCLPLQHQGRLTGVLYLENNAATRAFDPARVELLQALATQGAIAVENAKLYGELRAATAQLKRANETLELKVEDRTRELSERNRSLRLVLDHVDQGLLGVDREGRISVERSAKVDDWFGSYAGTPQLTEYIAEDSQFTEAFNVGLEALREDVLARELCIDQMPKLLSIRGRQYECHYIPVTEDDQVSSLLVTLSDVSERMSLLEMESEQKERLASYTALMRDRVGFLAFFDDAMENVSTLVAREVQGEGERRLLHALKGSAAMMGLAGVAELCQNAENDIEEGGYVRRETLEKLRIMWSAIAQTFSAVVGDRTAVEVSRGELEALANQVREGISPADLLTRLEAWRFEPAEKPLTRLAQYARALGHRLRYREIAIEIDSQGIRLDPIRFAPLWSALVHVVRNAVDHGVEGWLDREAAGKGRPRLRLAAFLRGDDFIVEVEDDGRGVDWASVRRIAAERGLTSATAEDLLQVLLRSDFSTRREATATSGRGVGLSVAAMAVQRLGGSISVHTEPGAGTCWRFSLPRSGVVEAPSGETPSSSIFSVAPAVRSA